MIKNFLKLGIIVVIMGCFLAAQGANTTTIPGGTPPAGAGKCAPVQFWNDITHGVAYYCDGTTGTWTLIASSGSSGTVTQIDTTAPITGGPITTTGAIACPTCTTSAAALTLNQLLFGAGLQAMAVGNLTGDITTSGGKATTLATVNSNVGTFGDATHVAQVTANAKGLGTAYASVLITGTAPGGTAGGDLSGTYPNPTVAQVNGAAVPASAAVVGTNSSRQVIAASGHGVAAPISCVDTSSSATTFTCTTTPSFTPAAGDVLVFSGINQANSGSSTLNINGAGAKTIKKLGGGTNLAANDLLAAQSAWVEYDGTNFQLLSAVAATPLTTAVTSVATTLPIAGGTITGTGTITCATCVTSAAALTNNQLVFGAGSQATAVGDLTGDVTTGGGKTTTLANIPTATPMAGSLLATAIAAPSTPAAGKGSVYVDSTSKNIAVKDDAGVIKHGVQTKAAVSNSFATAINDAGVVSVATLGSGDVPCAAMPALTGGVTSSAGSCATVAATLSVAALARTLVWQFYDGGTALTTASTSLTYITAESTCTINAWSISADAGTATAKVWKIAAGTAIPTISNVINTSGVALATGTHIRSTTTSDFTTTTITQGDVLAVVLTAVATATKLTFQLGCATVQ